MSKELLGDILICTGIMVMLFSQIIPYIENKKEKKRNQIQNKLKLDPEIDKLLYIYKRALVLLSQAERKEVEEHFGTSYEDYVKGVVKKHLKLGEEIEMKRLFKEDDISIDDLLKEFR